MDSFLAPFNTDERDKNNKLHLFKRVSSNQKLNSAIGKRPTEMVAIYGAAGVGKWSWLGIHTLFFIQGSFFFPFVVVNRQIDACT